MDCLELHKLRLSREHLPYRCIFVTVSGAHLYGFPSPDSDFDLRGVYLLPLPAVLGLRAPEETLAQTFIQDGREVDWVAHELKKFLGLVLNKNGYVLEQLYSPLVIEGGSEFEELRTLARRAITRQIYHHYAGFAHNQLRLLEKESPPRAKTLLYAYRVLLTGIHLLQTGEVESNLLHLNAEYHLPLVDELILRKREAERTLLEADELAAHGSALARLQQELEAARDHSSLPTEPGAAAAQLEAFLVRLRLEMQ